VKALVIRKPEDAVIETFPDPVPANNHLLLKVLMVGLCGSDLNSFRGKNPLVTYPRIPGHEVAATIISENSSDWRSLLVLMLPFLLTRTAGLAHHASVDGQMPANTTKLSAFNGTALWPSSLQCLPPGSIEQI